MLYRCTAIIISILYAQVEGLQQNGSSNIPNMILNRTFTFNTNGKGLQNKFNPIFNGQNNNLQPDNFKINNLQTDSFNFGKNLQQGLSIQQANVQNVNTQNVNNQLSQNAQQTQALLNGQQVGSTPSSAIMQQPVNSQPTTNTLYQNNIPQNIEIQQQGQNVQVIHQTADVSTIPNSQFSQTYIPSNPNSPVGFSISSIQDQPQNQIVYSNVSPDQVVYPQNQQVSYSVVPSSDVVSTACSPKSPASQSSTTPYIVDISQITNNIPAPITSPFCSPTCNQPSLVAILAPPQNIQPCPTQNIAKPKDQTNKIKVVKSTPTSCNPPCKNCCNNLPCTCNKQSRLTSDADFTSLLTSTLTNQASKSPNLNTLLPFILDLFKDRNNCGCYHHCDCPNNTRCDRNESYHKRDKYNQSPKTDSSSRYYNDYSEEYDDTDHHDWRRNRKSYGKRKTVKPVSDQYDYSDELFDD